MTRSGLLGAVLVGAFALFGIALVVSTRPGGRSPAAGGPASEPAAATPSGRTGPEEEAVRAAAGTSLRPATDEDAAESEARDDLYALYGDYRPFFVRGDFDADGRLDFAQAFVRRDGPEPLFDVAVFFGSDGGSFRAPAWVERGIPLAGGDLSADRSVLVVTDDVETESSRRWRWDAPSGRFVDVDAGKDEEGDEGWPGPGEPIGPTA